LTKSEEKIPADQEMEEFYMESTGEIPRHKVGVDLKHSKVPEKYRKMYELQHIDPELARKLKGLTMELKEGFTQEKDHDPKNHVGRETKEREQTGSVDGTGKEIRNAESEEESLEELTDGDLEEIEKKPKQTTFKTEDEIREEKHEAAKKKKKEVWDKARRDHVGLSWAKNIGNSEKSLKDVKDKLGKFKKRIGEEYSKDHPLEKPELTEGGAKVLDEAKRYASTDMYKATYTSHAENAEREIVENLGQQQDEAKQRQSKRGKQGRDARRRKIVEGLPDLKDKTEELKKRMTDPDRIQHYGRGISTSGGRKHESVAEQSKYIRRDPSVKLEAQNANRHSPLEDKPEHRAGDPSKGEKVRGTLPKDKPTKVNTAQGSKTVRDKNPRTATRPLAQRSSRRNILNSLQKHDELLKLFDRFRKKKPVRTSYGDVGSSDAKIDRTKDPDRPKDMTPSESARDQAVYNRDNKPEYSARQAGVANRKARENITGELSRGGRPKGSKGTPKQQPKPSAKPHTSADKRELEGKMREAKEMRAMMQDLNKPKDRARYGKL